MDEVVELFGKYSCARMLNLNCKVLGLVISGCRYIYDSERCVEVGAGSMFLLGEGLHFVKDMPTQDGERVCIVEIEIDTGQDFFRTLSFVHGGIYHRHATDAKEEC